MNHILKKVVKSESDTTINHSNKTLKLNSSLKSFYSKRVAIILNNIVVKNCSSIRQGNGHSYKSEKTAYLFKLFELESLPGMSFASYLKKVIFNLTDDKNVIVYALILMDRFINKGFILNEKNIYLSFLISFAVATKLTEDILYDENSFCKLVGILPVAFAKLENIFLNIVNYKVNIDVTTFNYYNNHFLYEVDNNSLKISKNNSNTSNKSSNKDINNYCDNNIFELVYIKIETSD